LNPYLAFRNIVYKERQDQDLYAGMSCTLCKREEGIL